MSKSTGESPRVVSVVAVHGVGDATPGEISRELSSAIETAGMCRDAVFERADLCINGIVYPRLVAHRARIHDAEVAEIIEVNWADVLRPADSMWQVIRHLFYLMIGMRHLSLAKVATGSRKRIPYCAWLFWASIEWVLWWVAFLAVVVMWLASCGPAHTVWLYAVAIGAPLVTAGMAWWLGRYVRGFRAGYAWVPVVAFAGWSFLAAAPGRPALPWVEWTASTYSWGQAFMGFALFLAFIEALVILRGHTWQQRFARAGLTWIPFLGICAVGAGTWVTSVYAASQLLDEAGNAAWQHEFLRSLQYDLLRAEVGTLSAVFFVFGLLPVVGLAAYALPRVRRCLGFRRSDGPTPRLMTPGETAHHMYAVILAVGPFALVAGGIPFWTSFGGEAANLHGLQLLEIYGISATRWIASFALALPVVRTILDVAGDVLFHLQPTASTFSSKRQTTERLSLLLARLRQQRPGHEILVLAHSQGSVIAWDVFRDFQDGGSEALTTFGSPLSTLCEQFLGGGFGAGLPASTLRWRNLYRDGDYIGGKVDGCANNLVTGPGGHTGYWRDPEFVGKVFS